MDHDSNSSGYTNIKSLTTYLTLYLNLPNNSTTSGPPCDPSSETAGPTAIDVAFFVNLPYFTQKELRLGPSIRPHL